MAKPNGDIIETPIISNFKEGLTVLEYFNSTHGARKGLSDTALKTANSGYLTRRLVDVAQDCIVRMYDCGTEKAITAETAVNDGEVVLSLSERLLGRVAAEDLLKPGTDEVLVARGELIDERMADAVDAAGLQVARIRSPLTCEAEEGVCALCYGRDLSRGTIVNSGEAVGIIAAQSIGEPGTQLTMRTFHIGGVAQGGQQSFLEASQPGKIAFEGENTLKNSSGDVLVVGRNMKLLVVDEQGEQRASHKLGYGSKLFVKVGQTIERGDKLFEWDPYTLPIIAEKSGVAKHVDLVNGIAVREETDDATGMTQKIVVDWRAAPKGNELKPEIILLDEAGDPLRNDAGNPLTYPMSVDAILSCDDGQGIKAGDVVARIPREGAKTKDITGGLPRVAELFEARRPKDHAVGFKLCAVLIAAWCRNRRHHRISDLVVTFRPGIDNFVIFFTLSDQTVHILLFEIFDLTAGFIDQGPFVIRHHHIIFTKRNTGFERFTETHCHDLIAEDDALFLTTITVDGINHPLHVFFPQQIVDQIKRRLGVLRQQSP
jgi:DNA-directed RNA polymerase subunit beta'